MKPDSQYQPLLSDAPEDLVLKDEECCKDSDVAVPSRRQPIALWACIVLQTIVIVILAGFRLVQHPPTCPINPVFPQVLYSPAQDALEYKPKTFFMGFGRHKSIYQQPPSDEVDKAWLDLYNEHGLSQIPKAQARLLPNKTLPIPGDEENYAVGLEVFHQLHCLDFIRQGLYEEYYRDPVTGAISGVSKEEWPDHLSHCLENIRQSLMCASDISLVVWQWNDEDNKASIMMNTVHSCRNFDSIVDWAKAHRRRSHFDYQTHVVDDIEVPIIYS